MAVQETVEDGAPLRESCGDGLAEAERVTETELLELPEADGEPL